MLKNNATNDEFNYSLKGYPQEPVAEDHIIIETIAKKKSTYTIELTNPYQDKDITYDKVITDLKDCSGPQKFTIHSGKTYQYVLTVFPKISGQYTGSITFYEENNASYIWYTILMNTQSPHAIDCIELSCQIRSKTQFEIDLQNPLDNKCKFDVLIEGEGLIGESEFLVNAQSSRTYSLTFQPLFVGKQSGSIAFFNSLLGEIWYQLELYSEDAAPVKLSVLKTELGKMDSQVVQLYNPLQQETKVQGKVLSGNFILDQEEFLLKPESFTNIPVRYIPATLDILEQSDVVFNSNVIGIQKFMLFGMGVPPTEFDEIVVCVGLNKDFSSSIEFKNPFNINIQVFIQIISDTDAFQLLSKKKEDIIKMQVPPLNVIQIPYSFVPRYLDTYYCEINIKMNEKIQWAFPIKGITESINPGVLKKYIVQCRDKIEDQMSIPLEGVKEIINIDQNYSFEVIAQLPEFKNVVSGSLKIKLIRTKNNQRDLNDPLEFEVEFKPLKPFKAAVDLNINKKSGGKWKYKIVLEATEPEPDDHITIQSELHVTNNLSFKLTNGQFRGKNYDKFSASFTSSSDPEFTVMPKFGELEPYSRSGTTFVVSFTPSEYGKNKVAKLIIQTDYMMWSYVFKGILPKYEIPKPQFSQIDNQSQMTKAIKSNASKNYMQDNIKLKNKK